MPAVNNPAEAGTGDDGDSGRDNIPLIAGGAAGALFIVIVATFVIKRRKRRSEARKKVLRAQGVGVAGGGLAGLGSVESIGSFASKDSIASMGSIASMNSIAGNGKRINFDEQYWNS